MSVSVSTAINTHTHAHTAARACCDPNTTHPHQNTNTHPSHHAPQLGSLPRLPQPEPSPPPPGLPDWRRTVGSNHQSAKPHTHRHTDTKHNDDPHSLSQAITHTSTHPAQHQRPRHHWKLCMSTALQRPAHPTHITSRTQSCTRMLRSQHQTPARTPTPTPVLTHRSLVHCRACPNQSPHHLHVTFLTGDIQWGPTISLPNHTHGHTAQRWSTLSIHKQSHTHQHVLLRMYGLGTTQSAA
jgi:hypothetical protein